MAARYELHTVDDCRVVLIALGQLTNRDIKLDRRIRDRAKSMKQALRNIIQQEWLDKRTPPKKAAAPVSIKRRTTTYKNGVKIDACFWSDGTVTVTDSTTTTQTTYSTNKAFKNSRHHTSGGRRHA